jgi:tRNA (mo5U34)-methyltransferase
MSDDELARRIASFPDWHYDFDLRGQRTRPAATADKAPRRAQYFMDPVIEYFGGSLAGKRVVDLGCNAGYFSLKTIEAGCDFVLGIDGRQMHVDQANLVFEANEIDPARYEFACANILDFDYEAKGPFDLVLCLGVLYHLSKPVDLFELIAPVNTDLLVIETKLTPRPGSLLSLRREGLGGFKNAVDYELVMIPTAEAVLALASQFGYHARILGNSDSIGLAKYRFGIMKAFVCSKTPDLDESKAFEFQSVKSLHADQERGLKLRKKRKAQRIEVGEAAD